MAQNPPDKKTSLAKSASWLLIAKTIGFIASVALPLLVVRRLSPYDVGRYKQVFLIVTTAVNVLPLGFFMSAYYFLPREPERRGQIVLNILLYSLFVGALAWMALTMWPSLLTRLFEDPSLAAYAPLIGLVMALWILGAYLDSVGVANQDMKVAMMLILGGSVGRTVMLLGALTVFGTVKSMIWAAAIHGLLQTTALLAYLEVRFTGFWRHFDWKMLRAQLSYGLPFGFAGLLYTLQGDLHNYFVSHQLGTVAFAVYSIGTFELPLAGILSEAVASVLIPRISFLQKEDRRGDIISLIGGASRKLAAVYFPLTALLAVVAHEFIVFLFTKRFEGAVPIFLINLCLFPFNALLTDPVIRAYADFRYTLIRIRVVLFAVLCVALWLGVARFGGVGAISVVVALSFVERSVLAVLVARRAGVSRKDSWIARDLGKLAMAACASALVTAAFRQLVLGWKPFYILAACGIVSAIVYVCVVAAMGIVTPEEWGRGRRWLRSMQVRLRLGGV